MRFKSLVSPLALVIGLGVAGAAVAQDAPAEPAWTIENGAMMINGAEITEEQSGYIQNYCNDLQTEFEDESAGEGGGGGGDANANAGEGAADEGNEDSNDDDESEPTLEDLPTSMIDFDLSQLTRDDCVEAGFITE